MLAVYVNQINLTNGTSSCGQKFMCTCHGHECHGDLGVLMISLNFYVSRSQEAA